MERLLLLGAGGHCKSIIDVIEQEGRFEIVGIIDNELEVGSSILDYKIIGNDDDLANLRKEYKYALIAVGQIKSAVVRKKLFKRLKVLNYTLPVVVSPLAYVSKYTKIDEGTVVMHHALINTDANVGKNCIINTKALIEHDVVVEDHCHISTGAIVNGGVVVKKETFYGSNATSKEYIDVNGFIKAGSVVK